MDIFRLIMCTATSVSDFYLVLEENDELRAEYEAAEFSRLEDTICNL